MLLTLPENISDIGCGLKLFKKDIVKAILPNLHVNRFALDSDILNEVGKLGCNVVEIPFFLNKNRSDSTSDNVKAMYGMIKDIFNISLMNKYYTIPFFKFARKFE